LIKLFKKGGWNFERKIRKNFWFASSRKAY
jgi:hypothetical protein